MANTKIEGIMLSKILEIKNNSLKPVNIVLIPNPDTFLDLKAGPEKFHKHYQNLAPTRKEQEQCLAQINTQLCNHCLILCDFQYCNECNLIYNLPPLHMIYTIPEEKPISSCALESESTFNPDSNSNNNDNENNSFSSAQYGNKDNNNLDSNSNPKTYIALPDLTKAQELKWFSDNNKAKLISMRNRKELEITARGIQGFGSTSRIDVPVNMAEEEVIDKGEIISTRQLISISPYDQYILTVKNQAQLFEVEATICESEEIGLTNLYISGKSPKNIKILIYNNTGNIVEIPEGTIIGYLTIEIEDQWPDTIPDFLQLCGYMDITSQTIYG
ncbi:hypothetical protein G9A89_018734 [Geosiphon pyriformis]|nr:hypothetical protein G9A89_018734 [Geosiphon pyriformis]